MITLTDVIFVICFVISFIVLAEFLKDKDAHHTQPWECINHGTQCEALQTVRDV